MHRKAAELDFLNIFQTWFLPWTQLFLNIYIFIAYMDLFFSQSELSEAT